MYRAIRRMNFDSFGFHENCSNFIILMWPRAHAHSFALSTSTQIFSVAIFCWHTRREKKHTRKIIANNTKNGVCVFFRCKTESEIQLTLIAGVAAATATALHALHKVINDQRLKIYIQLIEIYEQRARKAIPIR